MAAHNYMKVDKADFRVYSSKEILQLSVKEIVNPQTFDLLQNPVDGGLHDPALGPCRRDERCESCGQSELNCPGHMGHITLPVLLFNPLLFKTLLKFLKGTCLSCHRVNLPTMEKKIITSKIQLLQNGFLTEARELEEKFAFSDKSQDAPTVDDVNDFVTDVLRDSIDSDAHDMSKNKLTEIKNTIEQTIRDLCSTSTVCTFCKAKNRQLKAEHNHTIIGTLADVKIKRTPKKAKKQKEPSEDDQGGQDEDVEMEGTDGQKADKDTDKDSPIDVSLHLKMEDFINSKFKRCILTPDATKQHLRAVWKLDKEFMSNILAFLPRVNESKVPTDVFFLDVLPVPPSKFRPLSVMKEHKYEHPQTANLSAVLRSCVEMRELMTIFSKRQKGALQGPAIPESSESQATQLLKISQCAVRLQQKVNVVLDCDLDNLSKEKCNGVKQLLEKKEGLFRMHMMGKRVNYAARSVISPDPYIATNEMGIPLVFASKLTYPHKVTPWNVQQLRQMVINGPKKYPGAVSVINEDGRVVLLRDGDKEKREAIAKTLLVPDKDTGGSKTVCRHLINGDYLLLNRQPTLHRCSIQAHKARVLPNIKTLRMHYSNCKAYNADFDGDEMNAHFLQDELSRAEAETIVCTDQQYLAPRDGAPLAGLIQDHMVAGVALSIRGRFFSKSDYTSLVWSAMNNWKEKIDILPPAIIKPKPLWSGKQVISTILLNIIPKGKAPLNLQSRAKIPEKSWVKFYSQSRTLAPMMMKNTELMGESTVIISEGELLQGVLDKAHYGPSAYGLVHCCYELYGGNVAGLLLTYLGRLFTSFLQITGFSLGAGDILVLPKANKKRKKIIKESLNVGRSAAMKGLGLTEGEVDDRELLLELKRAHFDRMGNRLAEIDMSMKKETDQIQDRIAKCIMPMGLEKSFPDNSLQLMVQSGAKGSPVNCMQISCLLGQIELEGRRPPLMLSGRSLPSFLPYDVSPKAGGFVSGRFLTGIRPQEYFFHCMAGREGLIDTAVKTSRSGYLQRCLVKHLEGIKINYDMTVRDSDSSLIQFYYGEDGIEPARNGYLKPNLLGFLTQNAHALNINSAENPWTYSKEKKDIKRTWKKISSWKKEYKESQKYIKRESGFLAFCQSEAAPPIEKKDLAIVDEGQRKGRCKASWKFTDAWEKLSDDEKISFSNKKTCPDPVLSKYLPHYYPDVLSEKFRHDLNVFIKKGFEQESSKTTQKVDADDFKMAVNKKVVKSMAQPGEGVGLVLAQSIGEPSTQMTLNTFHFAGRGEMNVTLGIPRLREILMTGSEHIKTPQMDILVQPGHEAKLRAQWLQRHLNMITLDKILKSLRVKISHTRESGRGNQVLMNAKLKFLPQRDYKSFTNLTPRAIVNFIVQKFLPKLQSNIKKEMSLLEKSTLLSQGKIKRANKEKDDDDPTNKKIEDDDDDVEVEPNDGDMSAVKEEQRQRDTQGYEGEEEEREAVGETQEEDLLEEALVSNEIGEEDEPGGSRDTEKEGGSSDEEEADTSLNQKDKQIKELATSYDHVDSFKFSKKFQWCSFTLRYDQRNMQLDIQRVFERAVKGSVLHRVTGINRAFLSEAIKDGDTEVRLKTEGINIQEMFKYPDILDLNQLHCNCIHTMAKTYGIEAAYRAIIREIQDVFGAYGITVDYRHLSLLADFMTCRGEYDSFNRRDIHYNTSPIQKMTFETTMSFLLDACLNGSVDTLKSPSSQIVLGRPVSVGTGCFDILDPH